MAEYTRKNAWNNGGTFDNTDLLWYAKGVGAMMAKSLDDPSSWWFFAAIHGEYVSQSGFPGWGSIPGSPSVPTTPVPSPSVQAQFWDQCQHQSWFFPPWHRGYLVALEGQVRSNIIAMGGPSDWALPYWNYLGPDTQNQIPPAFTAATLPDGSNNPLFVTARYGPNNDGNIFVEIPPVNGVCESNTIYTGSNPQTPLPGFGGPQTGFSHGGGNSGNLESNPHNLVHVQVGGSQGSIWGLMSDPGIAALDPIFYLHHGNIDRMWAAWNEAGNTNPSDPNWLNGPASTGERGFIMPMADGSNWSFTPQEVNSLNLLNYTYDDLTLSVEPAIEEALVSRLNNLGKDTRSMLTSTNMDLGKETELIGANKESLKLKSSGIKSEVKLKSRELNLTRGSLVEASVSNLPDQVYLQLENVKGGHDSNILIVSVNGMEAGHVSLFGLGNASRTDSHHGGEGLNFLINITRIFDELHLNDDLSSESLQVDIVPKNDIPDHHEVTVGRIGVYREKQGQ